MAQTGYTPILIYSSSTAAQAPAAGNLTNSTLGSELAINITDGKLFYKDNANAVQVIAWKVTPTTAGGTGLTSYTQGDLLYYDSGTTLAKLAKSTTATRYLSNTGTNNNPAWAQIDLTNGVTGTLPVGSGGTGATTFTAGRILFGNATSAINTSANLFWDNANSRLGIGTTGPITQLSNTATAWAGGTASDGFAWRSTQNDWTATILGTPASGAGYGLRLHTLGTTTSDYPLFISSGASAGTAKFTVQGDGTTTFTGGNLVQGTAAKGVNFTANTPAAGMTSQLLNWYEHGAWTTGMTADTGTITLTYDKLNYTRVGRMVTISGELVIATLSSPAPTGDVYITLPFTSAASSVGRSGAWSSYLGVAYTFTGTPGGPMVGLINQSSNQLIIRVGNNAGGATFAGFLAVGTTLDFGFTYQCQ